MGDNQNTDKKKVTITDFLGGKKQQNTEQDVQQDDVKENEEGKDSNSTETSMHTATNTVTEEDKGKESTNAPNRAGSEPDDEQEVQESRKESEKNKEINQQNREAKPHVILGNTVHNLNLKKADIKNCKIKYFFFTLVFFLGGFLLGQYYETSTRNTVYVLDEAKFLKLASIGIATGDKDKVTTDLSEGDKDLVRAAMREANKILEKKYNKYPVLIKKRNKSGYDVYSMARRIDITVPLLIQLIGEDKWQEIGKVLK